MQRPSKSAPPRLSARARQTLGAAALVGASALVNSACDSTARIFLKLVQFDHMEVVGATPVKQATLSDGSSSWVPACTGDATGVRIDFNLVNTGNPASEDGVADEDRQIRPGEDAIGKRAVAIGKTLSQQTFELQLSCLEQHKGSSSTSNCPTPPSATTSDNGLQFVDHLQGAGRGEPMGVAIVIDQSGSTNGNVSGDKQVGATLPTCLEGRNGAFDIGNAIAECASDSGSTRIAQAKDFLAKLNPNDRKIVFQFSEKEGVKIVCNMGRTDIGAVANLSEEDKAANCYTEREDFVVGGKVDSAILPSAIDFQLQGKGAGRSNLWTAMSKSFDYMKAKGEVAKHIVVFTDGPDTCSTKSDSFQHCFTIDGTGESSAQAQCASIEDFEAFRAKVEAYVGSKAQGLQANDVHIHFIHFQSPGYPEYDARMQQIACLTGGHYTFLNTNQLDSAGRAKAFSNAVSKIRYSLGGHWGLVTGLGEFTADPTTSTAAADRGFAYALSGSLKLKGGTETITPSDELVSFSLGATQAGDERLALIRPCNSDADCNASSGECGVRCDPETKLCEAPAQGRPCSTGVCCAGACSVGQADSTGATVCIDASDFNSCP